MSQVNFIHEIRLDNVDPLIKEPFEITQKLFSSTEDNKNVIDLVKTYFQADQYNKGVIESILSIFYLIRPKQHELLTKIQITHESKFKEIFSVFSSLSFIPYEIISKHPIGSLVANDDLKKLQEHISKYPDFDFTQKIEVNSKLSLNFLEVAAYSGSPECFKYLLLNKVPFTDQICALAVSGGNYEIIHLIENQYESANYSSKKCFEASIIFHRYEITDWLLLNTKYEPDADDVHTAIEAFNYPVFVFLWQHVPLNEQKTEEEEEEEDCFDPKEINPNSMHFAAKAGNLPLLKFLIDKEGYDWNFRTYNDDHYNDEGNALHYACKYGHLDIVQYLFQNFPVDVELRTYGINKNDDINDQWTGCKFTPLIIAAKYGLKKKANIQHYTGPVKMVTLMSLNTFVKKKKSPLNLRSMVTKHHCMLPAKLTS